MPIRQTAASLALLLEVTAALTAASPALAQAQAPAAAVAAAPVPGTETPEATVKSLYAVISGPIGQKRDWDRFRALCRPDARLIATRVMPDGTTRLAARTVDEYIAANTPAFETMAFFESGETSDVHRNGPIATVISPYLSRHEPGGAPFAKGVNHFQLVQDGGRWWVVDIFWENEPAPTPPARK